MNTGQETLESMSQAAWYNRWTTGQFASYLHGDILEVGCGIGNFTPTLVEFGKVWAIDIKKDYIKLTKRRVKGKAQIGFGDIEKGKYFFDNIKFDTIICLNVLEHIENDKIALSHLFQLLKKGGQLILLVPSHKFLYGKIDQAIGHFRRYNKGEIVKELQEVGFKIERSRRMNFLGAWGWFIAGKVLGQDTIKTGNIKIFNVVAPPFLLTENLVEPPVGTSVLTVAQKP